MMTADNEWLPRSELLASHQKLVADVDHEGGSCLWSVPPSCPKGD